MNGTERLFALAGALLLGLVQFGCGGNPEGLTKQPSPPGQVHRGVTNYVIGPGDALHIDVWRNPEVSASVSVRPDGKISTPLIDDLQAVGKTPTELAVEIETALAQYIRSPEVTVMVQGFVGSYEEQIRVVGQAGQPTAISFREGLTLLDVLIQVGGLTETAAGNRARVLRWVGDEQKEIKVRLEDLLNRGRIEENILMEPGDVLIIPESFF